MLVADVMERKVVTVGSETTVAEIIILLADAHVSSLPVLDAQGRLLGVVSNTDVLNAEAEAEARELRQLLATTTAGMLMTAPPLVVGPGTTVREAAQQMLYGEVHRLYVVEHDRVVGVISTTDIVRLVATAQP